MSKGIKKQVFRKNLKEERKEVKVFEKLLASIYRNFNSFLFEGGDGSFNEFDVQYRALANKEYKFIHPDRDDFTKYAILK